MGSMNYKRVQGTQDKPPNLNQWNGFLDMHKSYYNGGANATTIPDSARNSVIVPGIMLKGAAGEIPPYSPVRLIRPTNHKETREGSIAYYVEPAGTQGYNFAEIGVRSGYDGATYGFTLAEGCTPQAGGRIVIGGVAVVALERDEISIDVTGTDGKWDTQWYNVPDYTISYNERTFGPVGHFKMLSWLEDNPFDYQGLVAADKVYVLLDLSKRPGAIRVEALVQIDGREDPDIQPTVHSQPCTPWHGETGSDREDGWMELQKDDSGFALNVWNVSKTDIPAGELTAIWSEVYNCFIALVAGASTTIFPVTLVRTAGEAGSATGRCTYEYSVKAFDGTATILQASFNPSTHTQGHRRSNLGEYSAATSGVAAYDFNGDLVILSCNEVALSEVC